jgi:hypothetical protein
MVLLLLRITSAVTALTLRLLVAPFYAKGMPGAFTPAIPAAPGKRTERRGFSPVQFLHK